MTRSTPVVIGLTLIGALLAACSSSGTAPNPPAPPGPVLSGTFTSGITASAALYGGVTAPDGRIWFSEFQASKLAAVTTSGTVTEYSTGANTQPCGVTVGPDNNLWAGGFGGAPGNSIEKITTGGTVTNYTIPGAHVCAIVSGPGGLLWFADYGNDRVGTISTSGTINEYTIAAGAEPIGIAVGSDGNLWVTDFHLNVIYKISPSATLLATYSSGISAGFHPNLIVNAPDGNLYFEELIGSTTVGDKAARITTGGTISELGTVSPNLDGEGEIVVGKDGNVYFAEYTAGKIAEIDVSTGHVSESSPMGSVADIYGLVAGPDGRLWVGGNQTIWALKY
ncbi:MAG TPA: hypothetical protein VIN40_02630 [Candidatus Tyrphobacter sp.]